MVRGKTKTKTKTHNELNEHMKNKLIKLGSAAAAILAVTASVQADPIVGSIGFTGTFTPSGPGSDMTTYTSVSITTTEIKDPTGAFANSPVILESGLYSPIGINSGVGNLASPVNQVLWSISAGGVIYTFTVNTEVQEYAYAIPGGSSSVGLAGTATITDTAGDDATPGSYTLAFSESTSGTQATFTFNNTSASSSVPDGGATAILLGAALSGVGLLRKKLIA